MIRIFAAWYWRRVKEIPLVASVFTLGCIYEAALLTVPSFLQTVIGRVM